MGGRFDIREPHGTCYVANTDETAVREIVGPDFIRSGIINDAFVSDRVVSQVTLHKSIKAAKLTDPLVFQFRVTNELSNMDNYTIPQAWAAAFHTSGFKGIWYQPRFSAGKSRALAMFGPTGPAKHGYETGREMRDVVDEMLDLSVVTTQGLDQYEVLDKPEGDF
ncbi:hypothetical protein E9229_003910 [Paeniglutamicibacter cryotolerans]|uniref:RES domain-containing protein n=2 Tax=Paeniglutamicibacter cryotolerans TaxID=670079 RepID=A0A839QMI1_9MICC|nr:hypothetical protein [Paeniglutamicibacter cryotolerans]